MIKNLTLFCSAFGPPQYVVTHALEMPVSEFPKSAKDMIPKIVTVAQQITTQNVKKEPKYASFDGQDIPEGFIFEPSKLITLANMIDLAGKDLIRMVKVTFIDGTEKVGAYAASYMKASNSARPHQTNRFQVFYVKNSKGVIQEVLIKEIPLYQLPNLSGTWTVTFNNSVAQTLILKQTGSSLTGTYKGSDVTYNVEGTIDSNNQVNLKVTFATAEHVEKEINVQIKDQKIRDQMAKELFSGKYKDFYSSLSFTYYSGMSEVKGQAASWQGTYDLKTFKITSITRGKPSEVIIKKIK